jgi:two-component system sensor histidine kinase ChiS
MKSKQAMGVGLGRMISSIKLLTYNLSAKTELIWVTKSGNPLDRMRCFEFTFREKLKSLFRRKNMQLNLELSHTPRLLIIDDDPMMQSLYKAIFEAEDYICDQVMNGAEALKLVKSNIPYDLVLLDILMPNMSGHEVCRLLRQEYLLSELPIIAVTAKKEEEDLLKGFSLGVNDYLKKPFTQRELLARIRTQLKLLEINRSFQRFVPREFLQVLRRESIVKIAMGDQVEGEMTVLFADIRDFTQISEQLNPQDNFRFLNDYLQQMTPIIRQHNGFIDKFVGDAIMALFPGNPDDAIQAAQAMVERAAAMSVSTDDSQLPIRIGIGLHTGRVMLGTIGDSLRMDVTVISDAVNLASRLQDLTKTYGCSITMSSETLQKCILKDNFAYTHLGEVRVKGKLNETVVYRVDA